MFKWGSYAPGITLHLWKSHFATAEKHLPGQKVEVCMTGASCYFLRTQIFGEIFSTSNGKGRCLTGEEHVLVLMLKNTPFGAWNIDFQFSDIHFSDIKYVPKVKFEKSWFFWKHILKSLLCRTSDSKLCKGIKWLTFPFKFWWKIIGILPETGLVFILFQWHLNKLIWETGNKKARLLHKI